EKRSKTQRRRVASLAPSMLSSVLNCGKLFIPYWRGSQGDAKVSSSDASSPAVYSACPLLFLSRGTMTPEELNKKTEFILETLARLTAAQEEERQSRLEFQEWSKGVTLRLIELADLQSLRLDRQEQRLDQQQQHLDQQEKFYRDFLDRT